MTIRLMESRRWTARQAAKTIKCNDKMSEMPVLFEDAAIHIGQYGWWRSGVQYAPSTPDRGSPCCIWLATEVQVASFGLNNQSIKAQVKCFVEQTLLDHFGLMRVSDLFDLNDRQPDHEGQAWAMYHLNTLAKQLRVRHGL